ncbi:jg4885 [Pararge aegeria aegeria]|uniref:Jg4885 protein n=1 Tax=Pararge aegeria aegeria TaxID=348720 RepID=A0A8S4RLX7_9NEOP|nr:jg4885 [Pararge aegeria aegeria]
MFCRAAALFAERRAEGGGRGSARNRSADWKRATWQHRRGALSVGSKWRLCVIDTVLFWLKMSVFVMSLVVGRPELCPVTAGPAPRKPVSDLNVRISNHIAPTLRAMDTLSVPRVT